MLGDTDGLQSGGDEFITFSHNTWASYINEGFTDFIEVEVDTAVYVQSVEIGENLGTHSIVKVKAWDSTTGFWQTLYSGEADPGGQSAVYKETNRARKFVPSPFCQTTFKSSAIRIEMDTYAIEDWNELDFVKVVGATELKQGVLKADMTTLAARVVYVPDVDYNGDDSFEFKACDCAYEADRASDKTTVSISVGGVNDAPIAQSTSVVVECAPKVADVISLQAQDVDADDTSFNFSIVSLPANALLYDGVTGEVITSDMLPAALLGASVSLGADYIGVDEPPSGFEFTFTATDAVGALSAAASIAVTCSATECAAGEYFDMDDQGCVGCRAGSSASDVGIRSSCEQCAVGTSAGAGSTSCASCDTYYVAMEEGLSRCTEIPSGTRWINASSYRVNPGVWRPKDGQLNDVYECPINSACPGGSGYGAALCADGFVGPLCAICADHYFWSWSGKTCKKCGDMANHGPTIAIAVIFVLGLGLCGLIIFNNRNAITQNTTFKLIQMSQLVGKVKFDSVFFTLQARMRPPTLAARCDNTSLPRYTR
jgi:hypothetical protein